MTTGSFGRLHYGANRFLLTLMNGDVNKVIRHMFGVDGNSVAPQIPTFDTWITQIHRNKAHPINSRLACVTVIKCVAADKEVNAVHHK